ncbi:MAG: ATP-binding protein [Clostridia bacterium]|nr:ATP-binding protein [Clostridia bacterium]
MMRSWDGNAKVVSKLMMRLLPIQILLAAVGAVNGIVSSFFASNYVGIDAMSAVGLYSPISMLLTACSVMLAGGSSILCGKYLGRNEQDKVQNVFSLNLLFSVMVAGLFVVLFLFMGLFDLTGVFTRDETVRPLFNRYLIGQVIGIFPLVLGNQLPDYLAMENRQKRAMAASLVYIGVNIVLNILFVQVLRLEAFGLALASSLGLWVFFGIQAQHFLAHKSSLRLRLKGLKWREGFEMVRIGLPGAASNGYETLRKIIVNRLLEVFVGSVGISAFAASDSLLRIFWSVPTGMLAISRLMISICVGEEDRQTLTDVMRVMFRRFIPIMCALSAVIIVCAEPFTRLFFQDSSEPVYMMTVWGFRILPLCMPLSIICMHIVCYGQASGKRGLVHVLALLDGVVCVAAFTALLIRWMGINSVYVANVLNGVTCVIVILVYSRLKTKHFPGNMDQLMVIPDGFGADPDARIDISVRSMDEVLMVSRQITEFCRRRGIDERRVYHASLCMEEMAGNIVEHGFKKDRKHHSIDIRVVHRNDDVIVMRIRDDCVPFDPEERKELVDPKDFMKNVGIRMVYKSARSVEHQSILGLNVLTIQI